MSTQRLDDRIDDFVRTFGGGDERARVMARQLRDLIDLSKAGEAVTTENRRRLTALVSARVKLDAAASLAKEATVDIARSGLMPRWDLQEITASIDTFVHRITATIDLIP